MSAEPRRVTKPEVWTRWEGQIVKGIFPLRRFLGCSDQGAVFLSEYNTGKTSEVAIKIVPAVASQAEARLAHWRAAAALSHPNLVRLFDMGRCQLGGREYLFVVMEYGEQTLAEFLSQRVLNADEVRALLLPTLDALVFLHRSQFVHAQLKPSNFLVVNDQLKLSSDVIRPFGHRGLAAADDIWSLGTTLVEAFTQRAPPSSPDEHFETSVLLSNIPAPFVNTVRRCLNPDPSARPNAAELQALYKSSAREDVVTSEDRPHAHPLLLAVPAVLLLSLVVWISQRPPVNSQGEMQSPAVPAPAAPAPAPERERPRERQRERAPATTQARPVSSESKPAAPRQSRSFGGTTITREVTPEVPQSVRSKIQGRMLVKVRVLVDASGDVMAVLMESAGPNRNLANLADQAAREWKFAPAGNDATRVWVLTFEFTQSGVTARATAV
jgi:TonB family protein